MLLLEYTITKKQIKKMTIQLEFKTGNNNKK